jgi:hypothetical protein
MCVSSTCSSLWAPDNLRLYPYASTFPTLTRTGYRNWLATAVSRFVSVLLPAEAYVAKKKLCIVYENCGVTVMATSGWACQVHTRSHIENMMSTNRSPVQIRLYESLARDCPFGRVDRIAQLVICLIRPIVCVVGMRA